MDSKKFMAVSILGAVLIAAGAALLLLGSLPMENKIEGRNLTVKFIIGQKVINISDAVVKPVPEDATQHIIRTCGTSVGKKHSGRFMNRKTKTKYLFYLTGKGEKTYFEIGEKKYLVDGVVMLGESTHESIQ